MAIVAQGSETGNRATVFWRVDEQDDGEFVGELSVHFNGLLKASAFRPEVTADTLLEASSLIVGNAKAIATIQPVEAPDVPDFSTVVTSTYVRAVQDWFRLFDFEKTGRANRAKPRHLAPFLDYLARITDEAATTAKKSGTLFAPPGGSAQFKIDMDRWTKRLANYRREVATAIAAGDVDSSGVVVDTVTAPLLLGIFSEPPPPGVKVPPDGGQGILDAVEPVRLAHQAEITEVALDDAWAQLSSDLVDSATTTASEIVNKAKAAAVVSVGLWVGLTAAGAVVLAIGVGAWYAITRRTDERGQGGGR